MFSYLLRSNSCVIVDKSCYIKFTFQNVTDRQLVLIEGHDCIFQEERSDTLFLHAGFRSSYDGALLTSEQGDIKCINKYYHSRSYISGELHIDPEYPENSTNGHWPALYIVVHPNHVYWRSYNAGEGHRVLPTN